jgi:hypothetical protein
VHDLITPVRRHCRTRTGAKYTWAASSRGTKFPSRPLPRITPSTDWTAATYRTNVCLEEVSAQLVFTYRVGIHTSAQCSAWADRRPAGKGDRRRWPGVSAALSLRRGTRRTPGHVPQFSPDQHSSFVTRTGYVVLAALSSVGPISQQPPGADCQPGQAPARR